jgi:hypothetical protein
LSEHIQQIREDIAYIRGLVEDDGSVLHASAIGLTVAGSVFGLAALRAFVLNSGWLQWPAVLRPLMPWDTPLVFFIVLLTALSLTSRGRPVSFAAISAASRTVWAGWAAVGFGYVAAAVSLSLAGMRDSSGVAFAFWGSGWLMAAAAYRRGLLLAIGIACYGAVIALGLLTGTVYEPLAMAVAFWLLVALPGLMLLRESGRRPKPG